MGDVISLSQRRAQRAPGRIAAAGAVPVPVVFSFDLASPWTYLAAERVDAALSAVTWRPVLAPGLRASDAQARESERAAAAARAAALRMPLVWPETARPTDGGPPARAAMRVAHLAAEQNRAAGFVLAASRLAFCGGFDLDDPEILAEAAAAAGLQLEPCLRAMGDRARDAEMELDGERLVAAGADRLPAFTVGDQLFCGEHRLRDVLCARVVDDADAAAGPGVS